MPSFSSRNKRLNYCLEGTGESRLVFIHGLCGKKELWNQQTEYFRKDYEVVALDCLGHGESSEETGGNYIKNSVLIIRDFLDSLPRKQTTLLGHSFGGLILNDLIEPNISEYSYVFVDSPCLHSTKKAEDYRSWGDKILATEDRRAMVNSWFNGFVSKSCSAENRSRVVDELIKFSPEWIAEAMKSVSEAKKKMTSMPILVMEGEQYFPVGNEFSWCHLYPRAQLWRYSGEGHYFFLEDPNAFNQSLQNFLDS